MARYNLVVGPKETFLPPMYSHPFANAAVDNLWNGIELEKSGKPISTPDSLTSIRFQYAPCQLRHIFVPVLDSLGHVILRNGLLVLLRWLAPDPGL